MRKFDKKVQEAGLLQNSAFKQARQPCKVLYSTHVHGIDLVQKDFLSYYFFMNRYNLRKLLATSGKCV